MTARSEGGFSLLSSDTPVRKTESRSAVTERAPHVRDKINPGRIRTGVFLALVPSIAMGMYNTGYQANLSMSRLGMEQAPGWRGRLLASLQLEYDPASVLDSLCHGMFYFLPLCVVTVVLAWFWETLFVVVRGGHPSEGFLGPALLFTLMLPPPAPLWQAAIGISFGMVFAKEVFGGTGKNFLNPALAGLVFLYFAYPNVIAGDPIWGGIIGYGGTTVFSDIQATGIEALEQLRLTWSDSLFGFVQGPLGGTSALASGLGAVLLIYWRIASWRIMAGILCGLTGTIILSQVLTANGGPVSQCRGIGSSRWEVAASGLCF